MLSCGTVERPINELVAGVEPNRLPFCSGVELDEFENKELLPPKSCGALLDCDEVGVEVEAGANEKLVLPVARGGAEKDGNPEVPVDPKTDGTGILDGV